MAGNLIQAKQINKILSTGVKVNTFTSTASNVSDIVTAAVTSVLSSAGAGGTSVPLQVSSNDTQVGVITTGVCNRVEIWDSTTLLKLSSNQGNEVYGRITEAAGVYTLSYYTLVGGVQTPFTIDGRDIDFTVNYRFDFRRFPADCAISMTSREVNDDPGLGANGRWETQVLTVTALNTVSSLAYTAGDPTKVVFDVNGQTFLSNNASTPFSVSGTAVTYSSGPFNLETTDLVTVRYFTFVGV